MYYGKFIPTKCRRSKEDIPVQNGLSLTPTEMMRMAQKGVPISAQNEQNFFDGVDNPPWDVAPEKMRGVDPSDLWQLQKTSRKKVTCAKRIKSESNE